MDKSTTDMFNDIKQELKLIRGLLEGEGQEVGLKGRREAIDNLVVHIDSKGTTKPGDLK